MNGVSGQVVDQVLGKLRDQSRSQIDSELSNHVGIPVYGRVVDQVDRLIRNQVSSQVSSKEIIR